MAVISSQRVTPSIEDVHSILLAHEGRINFKKQVDSNLLINYATNYKGKNQYNNKSNQSNQRANQSGRNRGRWNNNNRPRCIYEKLGHTAKQCYFSYDSNQTSSQSSNMVQNFGGISVTPVIPFWFRS